MSVPLHRIPKIKATCIQCEGEVVDTLMSMPFSAGYHRRHRCRHCSAAFYTLAPYDGGGKYTSQYKPFKDRPLSPWEQELRLQWASEAKPVTTEVTSLYATEFIETIQMAFEKQQSGVELTEDEQALIEAINNLEKAYFE